MDAVLINPGQTTEELLKEFEALSAKMRAAGGTAPRIVFAKQQAAIQPTSDDDAAQLFQDCMDSKDGCLLVFFPKDINGMRTVKRIDELEHAPNRAWNYFTIHRTGVSKPTKTSPGGIRRNFGVSVRLASPDEALKMKMNPGDALAAGYNVETGDATETPVGLDV